MLEPPGTTGGTPSSGITRSRNESSQRRHTSRTQLEAVISSVDHYLQARDRLMVGLDAEQGDYCAPIADVAGMSHQAVANIIERANGERP
jgi:hypothetical protein